MKLLVLICAMMATNAWEQEYNNYGYTNKNYGYAHTHNHINYKALFLKAKENISA